MNILRRSLARRMMLVQLLVVVSLTILIVANLLWQFKKEGQGEFDRSLQNTAKAIDATIGVYGNSQQQLMQNASLLDAIYRQSIELDAAQNSTEPCSSGFAIHVQSLEGTGIYRSAQHHQLRLDSLQDNFYTFEQDGQIWRAFNYRSVEHDLFIQVAQTSCQIDSELCYIVSQYIFWPLLLFLPFAALVSWLTSVGTLWPLRDLAAMIGRRSPNDMRPLVQATPYAETRPIVGEINMLLQKLEITLQRERDFLADAAHELRTPLAVIQAQAHVLEHATNGVERGAASDELHGGVERAANLIHKLLLTAKVSVHNFTPQFEKIELTSFVQERIAAFSVLAVRKHIDIELEAPGTCCVHIDRETFVSAIDNIIDNAIRYTPQHGQIRVCVEQPDADTVRVRIADNGIGIPQELHQRVFERFFRVAGTEQQGSGLGLAIVRRVLALHGGQVVLSPGLNQRGVSVDITLPLGVGIN
jgi:signal transduction histidine kinase